MVWIFRIFGIDISNLINCNNVDGMCITEISTNDILELSGDTDKTIVMDCFKLTKIDSR